MCSQGKHGDRTVLRRRRIGHMLDSMGRGKGEFMNLLRDKVKRVGLFFFLFEKIQFDSYITNDSVSRLNLTKISMTKAIFIIFMQNFNN